MVIRRSVPGQLSLLPLCLDGRDRAVLSFARAHHLQGSVSSRVHDELGLTETRYYQLLLQLLPRPEAADAEPELLAQLCALLERRRRLGGR